MKKSMGKDTQNPVREARNDQRVRYAASGGIGVPCSSAARIQMIKRFCARQMMPQALRSISRPIPPPMAIDKCTLDDCGFAFKRRVTQEAAMAIALMATARSQGLSKIPVCGSWKG